MRRRGREEEGKMHREVTVRGRSGEARDVKSRKRREEEEVEEAGRGAGGLRE